MIDKNEFLKLQELKRVKEEKVKVLNGALLKQAALKMEYVTKNEHWDFYLQHLQAKLEEANLGKLEWLERCGLANAESDWHQAQRQYLVFADRVKTLEEVMSLPATLLQASQSVQ